MNPVLKALLSLQEVDREIFKVEAESTVFPRSSLLAKRPWPRRRARCRTSAAR